MKFPQTFLAGAGVLTAGAGGEITGVRTALLSWTLIYTETAEPAV